MDAGGSSGHSSDCKRALRALGAAPNETSLRRILLSSVADIAVRPKRWSDGPDVVDQDVAGEGRGNFAELLGQRQAGERLAAAPGPGNHHARAGFAHPRKQPIGPAGIEPLLVERDEQSAVAAAFGNDRQPAIWEIVFGAALGVRDRPRPHPGVFVLDPLDRPARSYEAVADLLGIAGGSGE